MLGDKPFLDSSIIMFFVGFKSIFSQFLFITYPDWRSFGAGFGSGFFVVLGLTHFCPVIASNFGELVIGEIQTFFADIGSPLGAGRDFGFFASSAIALRKAFGV